MNKILTFLVISFSLVSSVKRFSIIGSQSTENQQLKIGDQIISTLGYFKFILDQKNCQLGVYQFDQTYKRYIIVDTYANSQVKTCQSLKILNNKIVSDTEVQFARLQSSDFQRTWLTIDDRGIIRFIGVRKKDAQSPIPLSQQVIIKSLNQDRLRHKNIIAYSNIKLNQFESRYTNSNNWTFQASNNLLKIYKETNLSQNLTFSLQGMDLDRSGVYSNNNATSPFMFFQQALVFPRCNIKQQAFNYKAPYTIQLNQYWPLVRIYDQQKYLIAQYAIGEATHALQKIYICPPGSFLMMHLCLKQCPQPYYEKIQGKHGQCVLTCELGSITNEDTRRCSCSSKDLNQNNQDTKRIKKCQRQWKSNFFGCDCSTVSLLYDRVNSLTCLSNCPPKTFADSGVCFQCGDECLECGRDNQFLGYLRCRSCSQGYLVNNGKCVKQPQNCSLHCYQCSSNGQCTKCLNYYSLSEGQCVIQCKLGYTQRSQPNKGSTCVITVDNNQSNDQQCYVGCLQCYDENCLSCSPGYVLFISPIASTCKLKTATLACPTGFFFEAQRQICYPQNIDGLNMAKCKLNKLNCLACQFNNQNICLLCKQGYFMYKSACVQKCPFNYIRQNNICIQKIKDCQSQTYHIFQEDGQVSLDLMIKSPLYKRQISNGKQPSNDHRGYQIYTKQFILQESTNNISVPTISRSMRLICTKCRRGYGISQDQMSCLPCPSTCQYQHCYYARQNSCYKPTLKCTFLDEQQNCLQSCPQGRFPQVDQSNLARCFPPDLSSVNDYLKIDCSFYLQDDGSAIYYFIFDKAVQNSSIKLSQRVLMSQSSGYHGSAGEDRRMLVQSQSVRSVQKGRYFSIKNTRQKTMAIAFDQTVNKFRTSSGFTLANSVYGAQAQYTHNQWMKGWLAYIGYILSWAILIVHCLYIGNDIMYKCDNLIIFCQTIYFFTFVKLLVGNTLSQYYYGWFWMHVGFFPNYFKGTVPSQYQQRQSPVTFKLSSLDGNFIRNAGFAISLLLTFLVVWIAVCSVAYAIYLLGKKEESWHGKIGINSLMGGVQLVSMVVFFFSVTQLLYGGEYPQKQESFNTSNVTFSAIFICLITLYMFIRFYHDQIAGLYMFKRLSVALILVNAFQNQGFLALLVAFELGFTALRYLLEKPTLFTQKISIFLESLSFIIAYFLLFLVLIPGINVILITFIIFVLFLLLIADLMDVYLQSRNQFYEVDILGKKYNNLQEKDAPESSRKMNL